MHHPIDRIVHTTAFVTPVMEHWLEREISKWKTKMKISLCYDHEKQDKVIYNILIKSSLYNYIIGYSGSAQSRTLLSIRSGRH